MATISSLLRDHVSLQVRSVDRLFVSGYVPRLQCEGQLIRFMLDRAGGNIPVAGDPRSRSAAPTSRRSTGSRWTTRSRSCGSPRASARRTSRGRTCGAPSASGRFGVVLIGVAQEKASAWRGWRDGGSDAHPHFEFGRQAVFVNHYYFYIRDREWGPSFVKTNAYAPYPVWL